MLGLSGLYFVVGKVRMLNVLTFPDLIARVTGFQSARPLAGLVLLTSGVLYLIMQLVGAGLLMSAVTGLPYVYMVWILGIVFIIYTVLGGMVSVAYTDLIQGVLMVATVFIAAAYMFTDLGGLTSINEQLGAIDASKLHPTGAGSLSTWVVGATFLAFFGTILTEQDMLIRIAATRDVRTAKIHIAASGAILSVFYTVLILLGGATVVALHNAGIQIATPDAAFPTLITAYVPTVIGTILILAVMSAILSTTDTRLHAVGMTVARDGYSYFRPNADEHELMKVSRTSTIALGLLATVAAMDPPGTIIVLYGLRAVLLTSAFLVPVYFAVYKSDVSGRVVFTAIVLGAVAGLTTQLRGGTLGVIPATFMGVGSATLAVLIGHYVLRLRRERTAPRVIV
jgi:sodium/proline symporter